MALQGGGGPGASIPGDPVAVMDAATTIRGASTSVDGVHDEVRHHGDAMTGRWSGSAASAAGHRVRLLSERTEIGAEVLTELAKALDDYAFELTMAQQDHDAGARAFAAGNAAMTTATTSLAAARAAEQPEPRDITAGERAVSGAREGIAAGEHAMAAAVRAEARANADAARRVNALTGRLAGMNTTTPDSGTAMHPSPTAVDAALRAGAGEQVPGFDTPAPYGLGDNATVKPLDPATQAAINAQLDAFGTGAKESVVEPVILLKGLTPGLSDDLGGHWSDLGDGLDHAVHHPWETAKAAVGWDDLSHGRYAHWAGSFAPSVAVTIATGGAAAPVAAGARATRVAHAAERAAMAAKEAEAAADAAKAAARSSFIDKVEVHQAEMERLDTAAAISRTYGPGPAQQYLTRTTGPRLSPVDGTVITDPRHGMTPEAYDAEFGPPTERKYPGERFIGDPDKDGFVNGVRRTSTVPVGTVLDRIGYPGGKYLSKAGVPWEERALPVETLDGDVHRYEVTRPLPEWVVEGKAAPAFGQPGGSIQYFTGNNRV